MKLDSVTLAVMNNRLAAIADEMGVVLGQTAFSPNIKERHDFSCAIFDARGELVAQAAVRSRGSTRAGRSGSGRIVRAPIRDPRATDAASHAP